MITFLWAYLFIGALTVAPLIGVFLGLGVASRWGRPEFRDRAVATRREVDEQVQRINLDVRGFVVLAFLTWPIVWVVAWDVIAERRRRK